jgi:DNA repair protein RadC
MEEAIRPRERVAREGVGALSDLELLALLLGTGHRGKGAEDLAEEVLDLAQGCLNNLASWPAEGLTLVDGIGQAKATLVAAAMELGRRRHHTRTRRGDRVASSQEVYLRFASRLSDLQHEEFWVLLLRRSNRVLAEVCISKGGLTGTVVDPKMVFGRALAMRAAALVLVHNHPSGNPQPSDADRRLTSDLCKAGTYLDLPVLDHVIVAGGGFVSFADQGWLT